MILNLRGGSNVNDFDEYDELHGSGCDCYECNQYRNSYDYQSRVVDIDYWLETLIWIQCLPSSKGGRK